VNEENIIPPSKAVNGPGDFVFKLQVNITVLLYCTSINTLSLSGIKDVQANAANSHKLQSRLLNRIPYFRYMDNSVHFHECSPFWVGISTICI